MVSQVFAAPELTGTWPIPITSISPGGNFGIKILVAFYYRGSLHSVISELVIPAISYISVTNFGNSLPIHDFHKKTHTKYFQNFDKNFPKKKKFYLFFRNYDELQFLPSGEYSDFLVINHKLNLTMMLHVYLLYFQVSQF